MKNQDKLKKSSNHSDKVALFINNDFSVGFNSQYFKTTKMLPGNQTRKLNLPICQKKDGRAGMIVLRESLNYFLVKRGRDNTVSSLKTGTTT